MPIELNASSKAEVDTNFEAQLKRLQKHAEEDHTARKMADQSKWYRPDDSATGDAGWDGDLFDLEGMGRVYTRKEANDMFLDATKDPKAPGVTGDLIVTTTMVDYLALMERAFRSRHSMRRPRAVLHAMGRKFGHGHDNGVFIQAGLEYIRGVLQQAKAPQT